MPTKSEAWIFGRHGRNQSAEKGSIPLGGEAPFTSLYTRSSRSRLSVSSDSSTCRRAPSITSSAARRTCSASATTLFAPMVLAHRLGGARRHHDRGVRLGHCRRLVTLAEQLEYRAIVDAQPEEQQARLRHARDLRGRKPLDDAGHVFRNAEAEHRRRTVAAQHLLREQEVGQVRFPDLVQKVVVVHRLPQNVAHSGG